MTFPLLQQTSVLVLNRFWVAIDAITPVEAFGHLVSGSARALRIDGDSMLVIGWDEWRELVPVTGVPTVGTPRGPVRIPTVILLNRYARVPLLRPRFGFRALWERDGGRCQYTGRRLHPHEANIDHVLPRSRGGTDSWENCVLSDRAVNTRKGARTPGEAGLTLLRQPKAPRPIPATATIRNTHDIADWNHFLPGA